MSGSDSCEHYFLIRRPGLDQEGPFTSAEMLALIRNRIAGPQSLYWYEGAADWAPVDSALTKRLTLQNGQKSRWWVWLLGVLLLTGAIGWGLSRHAGSFSSPAPLPGSPTPLPLPTQEVEISVSTPHPTQPPTPTQTPSPTPAPTPRSLSVSAIAKELRPCVGLIHVFDDKGKVKATGTGWVVSKDGLFVTNYHVVQDSIDFAIKLGDGGFIRPESSLYHDRDRDFAVFRLPPGEYPAARLRPDEEMPVEGEEVVVLGNPLGLEASVSTGIVSAIRADDPDHPFIQISAPISPGSSGSPVTDDRGRVLGMATASQVKGQALNFAIPVTDITRALGYKWIKEQKISDIRASRIKRDTLISDLLRMSKAGNPDDPNLSVMIITALGDYPDDEAMAVALGDVFYNIGQPEKAADIYDRWLRSDSRNIAVMLAYAHLLLGTRDFNKVNSLCHDVIRIDPKSAQAYEILGGSLGAQGQVKKSLEAFQAAIEIDPSRLYPWFAIGVREGSMGNLKESIWYLEKALELAPENPLTLRMLMSSYFRADLYKDAAAVGEQYVKIKPNSPVMWDQLGTCYLKLGKAARAVTCSQTAVSLAPKSKSCWGGMWLAYENAGLRKEAAEAYQKYLHLPDDPPDNPLHDQPEVRRAEPVPKEIRKALPATTP